MEKWLLQSHAPKEGSKTWPLPVLVRCLEHGIRRRGHSSLLCGWSPHGQGIRWIQHQHVLLDHSSPAKEKGWEEAVEGSFLRLTTSLSGAMDIHFPNKPLGQPCLSVSFPKPAHQTSVLQRPCESQEEASLRHGNPEWSCSPAHSRMLSDNNVLIKDLSLKYYH